MNSDELNERIRFLVQSSSNTQEFMDLASISKNWKVIDKSITLPREVGFTELDCPSCLEPLRLIYDKFATLDYELELICPHCREKIRCIGEFTGYTNEIILKEL
ncbi:MAG: hypothetical protein D4R67_07520 [Bacteroidetes bacterium]|nr:MAG: hypothetical protein D4R67_07520 [Bacteroidota bacterium]